MSTNEYPLISVLFPCYNSAEFLEEAVKSIQNQTYSNLEIIIIDDCSTDNSLSILKNLAATDKRIKVYQNETNSKLIYTLNRATSLATGLYVARMDSDDISHTDRLKIQYDFLVDHKNIDVVSCNCINITEKGLFHSYGLYYNVYSPHAVAFTALLESPVLHTGILCKREIFSKHNYAKKIDNLHVEDYELWTRLILEGYNFAVIPTYLYYYRRNPNGVSLKYKNIQNQNQLKCAQNFIRNYINYNVSESELLILGMKDLLTSYQNVSSALNILDIFERKMFLKGFTITEEEKNEIRWWKNLRTIQISIFWAIKTKSIKNSIRAIGIVLNKVDFFLSKKSLIFTYNSMRWAISKQKS